MAKINLMRVYDSSPPYPKYTFLIDRLWPQGLSKAHLESVTWIKEVGSSDQLRKWYHHDVNKWPEFEKRYQAELSHSESWKPLLALLKEGKTLTFLYGSKDKMHNQAVVLKAFLMQKVD